MNSLPFLTRLIAATLIAQQNKALITEVAYLRTEIAYYREQLPPGTVFRFTDHWRRLFARSGAAVGWKRLAEIATVVKAKTIQGWERLRRAGKLGGKRAGPGRPRVDREVEMLVLRMAEENPTWGQLRIAGMLLLCLIAISPRTIAAILERHGLKPAPERVTDWSWKRFMTENADTLVATDFFTVEVGAWLWKRTYDVLFAIHLKTRQVKIMGVTEHSDEAYMMQVARNLTWEGGWLKQVGCRHLIHDGDGKFCPAWKEILRNAGIEPEVIPAHSPNCNAFAERWVRTVKRECIRRLRFLDYGGLCKALTEFVEVHYNLERPHQGLGNRPLPQAVQAAQAPAQKSITGFKASDIRCVTRCGGAVRHYYRVAA
jgi:transposase InsO family protein